MMLLRSLARSLLSTLIAVTVASCTGGGGGPGHPNPDGASDAAAPDAESVADGLGPDGAGSDSAAVAPDAATTADVNADASASADADASRDAGPLADGSASVDAASAADAAAGCGPATCQMFAGHYAGNYRIYTDERLGTEIINMMECTGTSSIDVDPGADAASSVVRGTLECSYPGGLTFFGNRQTATLEASLRSDGTISGRLMHRFDPSDSSTLRTFTFTGLIDASGSLTLNGTGSWSPNAASAVAWAVQLSVSASR
jgi:hypothetical protein